MAKIEDAPELEGAPKKKKSKLVLIILLLVILGALGGGGWFAWNKFFKAPPPEAAEHAEGEKKPDDKKDGKKEEKKDEKKDDKKKDEKKEEGGKKDDKNKPVTSITNIVTNLADAGGKRYVRMSVEFDFKDDAAAREFSEKYQARVKDTILTLLWSKTSEEISSVDGMIALRAELMSRVNQIMGQGMVKQVFITDRVIQ